MTVPLDTGTIYTDFPCSAKGIIGNVLAGATHAAFADLSLRAVLVCLAGSLYTLAVYTYHICLTYIPLVCDTVAVVIFAVAGFIL